MVTGEKVSESRCTRTPGPQKAMNAVRRLSGKVVGSFRNLVEALVSPAAVKRLAADTAVREIRRPARLVPETVDLDQDGVDDSIDNCVGAYSGPARLRRRTAWATAARRCRRTTPRSSSIRGRRPDGTVPGAGACSAAPWSPNSGVTPLSGDGCTTGWFWYSWGPTDGPVPDSTYTITVTQTSAPPGCTGTLSPNPLTFVFGPGRHRR